MRPLGQKEQALMTSKLIVSFVFLAVLLAVGGFIALGIWDLPIAQQEIEKPVTVSGVL